MSDIIVPTDDEVSSSLSTREEKLVSWVLDTIQPWIDHRDENYEERWDEYYRLWRGIYKPEDKTRGSERSKLIAPALQQAIETAVAEIEESVFGKGKWFDVDDDVLDQNPQDMQVFRTLLPEDLDTSGVRTAMSEVFLNGALYGTGIGKIVVEEVPIKKVTAYDIGGGVQEMGMEETDQVQVKLIAVEPREFAIDPAARTIDEALGCAHIMTVPKHSVLTKQQQGIYNDIHIGSMSGEEDFDSKGESSPTTNTDRTQIIEYHGLVPKGLLEGSEDYTVFEEDRSYEKDDVEFIEAIITIANGHALLKEVQNPYTMQDRCFIAYQHDTVPNRFWGRGVAEKGYNPQKALDAELRARIDAMALTIHPMMGVDATRIPRGADFSIKPGRSVFTNGDPSTVLKPFSFGQVSPDTFHQSGELERMVQMATGSMDSAAPVGVSPRNATMGGMSMILANSIKRNKRTLANIEEKFTSPLVHKAAWRYMQLDNRYPVRDVKFRVYSTLGIMAREFEQSQLSQLLNTVPPDSPAYWMLIRGIYSNSSITDKDKMLQLVDSLLQQALQPKQPTPLEQAQIQNYQQTSKERMISLQIEKSRADTERARVMIEAEKVINQNVKTQTESILNLAKAEAEEAGTQLNKYKTQVDAITAKSTGDVNASRGKTD